MDQNTDDNICALLLEGTLLFNCELPVSYPIRHDHVQLGFEALDSGGTGGFVYALAETLQKMREMPGYSPLEEFCTPVPAAIPVGEVFCVIGTQAVKLKSPASPSW